MLGPAASQVLVAALRWDPHIRGGLIVLTGVMILMGSVYLLLSTNTGARLGFVLAVAGLSGWMVLMGAVWTVFGIGLKGQEPQWRALELLTGPPSESTVEAMRGFPKGWKKLPHGDPALSDAEAASDAVLASSGAEGGGEGGSSEGGGGGGSSEGGGGEGGAAGRESLRVEPPFRAPEDYELVQAYRKGGETYFLTLLHRPHYAVLQVKPVEKGPDQAGGQVGDKAPSLATVVMVRDLGNLRLPSFIFTAVSAIVFGLCVSFLHRRDKRAVARATGVT